MKLRIVVFMAFSGFFLITTIACAQVVWQGGTDESWSTADNWVDGSVPADGDDVIISDSANGVNTFFDDPNALMYESILVDNGMHLLNQSGYDLNTNYATIGQSGTGFLIMDSGLNVVYNNLNIGVLPSGGGGTGAGEGTCILNDATFYADVVRVGGYDDGSGVSLWGAGAFEHNSGTNDTTSLFLGDSPGSVGTYNINMPVNNQPEGALNVYYTEIIGKRGIGYFNQQCGQNVVYFDYFGGYFSLGEEKGAAGTYNMSGGELDVTSWDDGLGAGAVIGNYGSGVFNHSGGNVSVSETLVLGRQGWIDLVSGDYHTGTGEYNMLAGGNTVPALVVGTEIIGYDGKGTFNQQAGTNTVVDLFVDLYADADETQSSVYDLTGGVLDAVREFIGGYWNEGRNGSGIFNQTGNSVNSTSELYLADTLGSKGVYNMNAGQLTVGESAKPGKAVVGQYGRGYFNQDGGTVTIYSDPVLANVGSGSYGSYAMTPAVDPLNPAPQLFVKQAKGSGGNIIYSGAMVVGADGHGVFTQKVGDVTLDGNLIVGQNQGSVGEYYFHDGNLTVNYNNAGATEVKIGDAGTGNFYQYDGVFDAHASAVYLGDNAGGSGYYTMSGGTLNAGGLGLGEWGGYAMFVQKGGTVNTNAVQLARQSQPQLSEGHYEIEGGGLNATFIQVGAAGKGYFKQSGGEVNDTGDLNLGQILGSEGTYELSGDSSSVLNVGNYLYIGIDGKGTFAQSGGKNLVTNGVILGMSTSGTGDGRYELSGGELSSGWLHVGPWGKGVFVQSGGTNTVNGEVRIQDNPGSSGTYEMSGGTLTAAQVINNGTFLVKAGSGASPVVNAPVKNYGTVEVNGTEVTFNGDFTNYNELKSDPAVLNFTDLTVDSNGYITAGAGDEYNISGDFLNYSTKNTNWNTSQARLTFKGNPEGGHVFALASADLGAAGYADNFAWNTLDITGVEKLTLQDGNNTNSGGALYVGSALGLDIDWGTRTVNNVYGSNGITIYFLPSAPGNEDLTGTFSLTNGGSLTAAPEPVSCVLFVLGGGVLAGLSRRRKR